MDKKAFDVVISKYLIIFVTIIIIIAIAIPLYSVNKDALSLGVSVFDANVNCGEVLAGLYETKCFSSEHLVNCYQIGWLSHMETGKAKGCFDDEMCCKRELPNNIN